MRRGPRQRPAIVTDTEGWRLSVSLQNDRPLSETLQLARLAEELGFAEIWINENGHFRGAFTQAAAIASPDERRSGSGSVSSIPSTAIRP